MESTLALQLSDYAAEIGDFLGYGRTTTSWTGWSSTTPYYTTSADSQLARIMNCVNGGLRWFYFCDMPAETAVAHVWSFLSPQRSLAVVADVGDYDLPDDIVSPSGKFTYQPGANYVHSIKNVGIGELKNRLMQYNNTTGPPLWCAVYPKPHDGVSGQRFAVSFCPTPNAAYTFDYTCNVIPNALTANRPYPYGGMAHASTIMAAMKAFAEATYFGEETTWRNKFMERLRASISLDMRESQPSNLGYYGDRRDGWHDSNRSRPFSGYLTFEGILYEAGV